MSFEFNGSSDYLAVSPAASVLQDVASQMVVILFRADSTGGTGHRCLFSCKARATAKPSSYTREIQIGHNEYVSGDPPIDPSIRLYVQDDDSGGTNIVYGGSLDFSSSQWYVGIVVFSGGSARDIYLYNFRDSSSEASASDTTSWVYAANGFVEGTEIGRAIKSSDRYFDGDIAAIFVLDNSVSNTTGDRASLVDGLWGMAFNLYDAYDGNANIALWDFDSDQVGSTQALDDRKGETNNYDLSLGSVTAFNTDTSLLLYPEAPHLGLSC